MRNITAISSNIALNTKIIAAGGKTVQAGIDDNRNVGPYNISGSNPARAYLAVASICDNRADTQPSVNNAQLLKALNMGTVATYMVTRIYVYKINAYPVTISGSYWAGGGGLAYIAFEV